MKQVRIGNGCGFWGDQLDAPRILVESATLDYLTLEYLAELTMSILGIQKGKDAKLGYASDFIEVLKSLVPALQKQSNLRIITNAGGMNPRTCAEVSRTILNEAGLKVRKIAVVHGDDLIPNLDQFIRDGVTLNHLDTNEPLEAIRSKLVSANAYLGAAPIVAGLRMGADLVITGRVADASLTVAPAIHELGWSMNQTHQLAAATVAGHLIECGAQVTGGLAIDWESIPGLAEVGYPIAEIDEQGTVMITKPAASGGRVTRETVLEQLLYEVNDPANYLTPDVIANFADLEIETIANDRIAIRNASGKPATDEYKVSMAYRDGYASSGTLLIAGPKAREKAELAGKMILDRLERIGIRFSRTNIETIGSGMSAPGIFPSQEPIEVMLRVSVHDPSRQSVERFTREFAPLVTSGPPGVSGYTTGRPVVREVLAYWPALIAKSLVDPLVRVELH